MLFVDAARADTPGCERIIHLNNAGSSLPPVPVVERVIEHLRLEAAIGGYEAAARCSAELGGVRPSIERLIGAPHGTVALAQSDTGAWTKALWGLFASGWFAGGGRVLVDRGAYNSHYLSLLQVAERDGIEIVAIESTADGTVDLTELDRLLDTDVRLVTATHVGTHRGLVNPVEQIGDRLAGTGIPFFLDACQSVGQMSVDVTAIRCAVATGTGRKFLRGPRGTGFVYAEPEWADRMSPPGMNGASGEWVDHASYRLAPGAQRFEEFEASIASQLGLGVAARYAAEVGLEQIEAYNGMLAEQLRDSLTAAGCEVHDGGTRRSAIVTFTVPGESPEATQARLADSEINVSVTTAPWARLDMESRGLTSAVRASVHYFNTTDELDRLLGALGGAR